MAKANALYFEELNMKDEEEEEEIFSIRSEIVSRLISANAN